MATPDILLLIEKYLHQNISEDELTTLNELLKDGENAEIFKNLVKDDYQLKTKNVNFSAKESFFRIKPRIEEVATKKVIHLNKRLYKYAAAAAILIVVALSLFFNTLNDNTQFVEPILVNQNIKPGVDKATLTLEDGAIVALEKGNIFQTKNAKSNGEEILYEAGEGNTSEGAYNYLTVPRGGQFFIKLSDGTQVWLNSESQLKYPVAFIPGKTRQVELVYGEAYFDVSPSSEHNGSKFQVFNQSQEIEVLGTEFNLKAYKDETNVYTTLVEGKVVVSLEDNKQYLSPNQQSNFDLSNNSLVIKTVDVYDEISWKEGVFVFKNKSLKEIMKVLSRWYNVDVVFKNKSLESEEFIGSLGRSQNIEEILLSIKYFGIINNYQIKDEKVILE